MFIRKKTSPNSPRLSLQIVEGYRDPQSGNVKQRIIRHLGVAHSELEVQKLSALGQELIQQIQQERDLSLGQPSLFEGTDSFQKPTLGRPPKKRLEDILPLLRCLFVI